MTTLIFTDIHSGLIYGTESVDKGEFYSSTGILDAAKRMYLREAKESVWFEYASPHTYDGFAVHFVPTCLESWADELVADDYQKLFDVLDEPDEYIIKR